MVYQNHPWLMAHQSSIGRLSEMEETVAGMRSILAAQVRLVDSCLHHLSKFRDGSDPLPDNATQQVLNVVLTMVHVTGVSCHSILKLTEEIGLQTRDGYPVARGIVESTVNVAYIMAEGNSAADRASRHAEQKAFRDLKRTSTIGDQTISIGWMGRLSTEETARLEQIAQEFTTRGGRERRDWIDINVEERLKLAAARFGPNVSAMVHVAMVMVYRHASEILHGTYFGALFFWGVASPQPAPRSADGLRLIMADHQFTILNTVIFAVGALLDCVGQYFGLGEIRSRAAKLVDGLAQLPAIRAGLNQSSRE